MHNFIEQYRHLPTIPGRDEWNKKGGFSLGELLTGLWVTAENQAIYIKELNEDIKLIESDIIKNEHAIRTAYQNARQSVENDPLLSAEVKEVVIGKIDARMNLLDSLIKNIK